MIFNKRVLTLIYFTSVVLGLSAQDTVKGAFVDAPFNVIPTLSKDARLDMLDYFQHGSDHPSTSYFGEGVRITALNDYLLTAEISPKVAVTLGLLTEKADTFYVVTETVETPAKDSRVTLYTRQWQPLYSFDAGTVADWLTVEGEKEKALPDAENTLSFITAEASFDPATNTVVYTNTSAERIEPGEYSKIARYILPQRSFLMSSKGVKPLKK